LKSHFEKEESKEEEAPAVVDWPPSLPRVFLWPKSAKVDSLYFLRTDQLNKLLCEVETAREKSEKLLTSYHENIFILAGPSGIGKSMTTLFVALRLYASSVPVLYIPDALTALNNATLLNSEINISALLHNLFNAFVSVNADLLGGDGVDIPTLRAQWTSSWVNFKAGLNSVKAVIIIDEQGHAYQKLKQDKAQWMFPLLDPNSYLEMTSVQVLFCGSNQEAFERDQNETFRQCFRFCVPFNRTEIDRFLTKEALTNKHDIITHLRYAGGVPREMISLGQYTDPNTYTTRRTTEIVSKLSPLTQPKDEVDKRGLIEMLDGLFQDSTIGGGTDKISFLDMGYVYRKVEMQSVRAYPLCFPATCALVNLWHSVKPPSCTRLLEVVNMNPNAAGLPFEQLCWDTLVRQCNKEQVIPYFKIGHHNLPLKLRFTMQSFIASTGSAKKEDISTEIRSLQKEASNLKINILYRCPNNATTIDFFLLLTNQDLYAFQVSISALTAHTKPDGQFLQDLKVKEYIYITTSPSDHSTIAKKDKWNDVSTDTIGIVDAHDWLNSGFANDEKRPAKKPAEKIEEDDDCSESLKSLSVSSR
jgi:hypothetical protein